MRRLSLIAGCAAALVLMDAPSWDGSGGGPMQAWAQTSTPYGRPGAIMPSSPGTGNARNARTPTGAIPAQALRPGSIPPPESTTANGAIAPATEQPAALNEPGFAPIGRRFDQQRVLGSRPPIVLDRAPQVRAPSPPVMPKVPTAAAPTTAAPMPPATGSVPGASARPAPVRPAPVRAGASQIPRGATLTCPAGQTIRVSGNTAFCR